ncbi:AAA+ family ATPase [Gemmobacter sp.]|uniref:AAA+ family ATPase n=1 Tax=Gemmobacter sp. TaxID=1898957 RepID=UPI002AFE3636|nr:AAA+ family ATPase [Gemmobacter sp.]
MRPVLALALCLTLAAPLAAEETPVVPEAGGDMDQGLSLLGEGARLLFRGLMAEMEPALDEMAEQLQAMEPMLRSLAEMIGDIRNYEAPVKLPNGDILIRRRPEPPAPDTEIEL